MVSKQGAGCRGPSGEGIIAVTAEAGDLQNRDVAVRIQRLQKRIRWSANWFFGIALLSMVHSAFELTGLGSGTLAGLGLGRMINLYALSLADELGFPTLSSLSLMAFGFNLAVAAFFVIMGYVARQEFRLAFLLGIFFYLLDGIILLGIQDFQAIAFHCVVLFLLARGLSFCKELEILQAWWERTRSSRPVW
ncbi:MAG: hypothetical protein PHF14_03515 [Verrucomicrobiota bacterium]|jgi:hypothetical protein|nr:hypothetical protein [Verrucomicrobiota bacterium]MDD8050698.1 hypothetical protein [Verrucomicrobiota bacterium]MDI9383301.1 hypothetical protein [Verrucomicrobiota bacterium]